LLPYRIYALTALRVATRHYGKGWHPMQLAKGVKTFSSACEHILSAIATNRPLTQEEAAMIESYCLEILAKVTPLLRKGD
jgi:chaperonin GroEL (HSP60 family)